MMALAEVNLSPNVISTCHAFLSRIVKRKTERFIHVTEPSWGVPIFGVFLRVVPLFLPSISFEAAQKSKMVEEGIRLKMTYYKVFMADKHKLALRLT
jgi:hypothetical protein